MLWASEELFGLTLFEFMQQPSTTCRDVRPGCVGLEPRSLSTEGLTLELPESCGPGVLGLETPVDAEQPGHLERSYLLEIEEPGDVTLSFSGLGGAELAIAACEGFDKAPHVPGSTVPVRYVKENSNAGPWTFRFEAGQYRLIVWGLANDEPAMAHLEFAPVEK